MNANHEKLSVLVALTDSQLAHQIVQKVRAKFPELPLEIDFVDDGKRALTEYRQKNHAVLFLGAELPGMNGATIVREIRKLNGAVAIYVLATRGQAPPEAAEAIDLPIVDWTDFLSRFRTSLPDEWKAKFGLFERNSGLYQKLVEYGKRYATSESEDGAAGDTRPIICIPHFFDEDGVAGSPIELVKAAIGAPVRERVVFKQLTAEARKKTVFVEVGLLATLTLATVGIYYWKADGSQDSVFSLKSFVAGLTAVSYFGFFLGRVFDRFVLAQETALHDQA